MSTIARTPAEVATLTMGKEPTTAEERAEWTRLRDAVAADRAGRAEGTPTPDAVADDMLVSHGTDATFTRVQAHNLITEAVTDERARVARDEVTVTLPSGQTLRVWVGTSDIDGSALVQIDTEDAHGNVRVFVNDSGDPVFNENPETGRYEDMAPDGDDCGRCGDTVHTVSTDGLCDGCVAEDATAAHCAECGERIAPAEIGAGWGMCAGCVHNARRSGWEPGADA